MFEHASLFVFVAFCSAAGSGICVSRLVLQRIDSYLRHKRICRASGVDEGRIVCLRHSFPLYYAAKLQQRKDIGHKGIAAFWVKSPLFSGMRMRFHKTACYAAVQDLISAECFVLASLHLSLVAALISGFCGSLFSNELALLGFVGGAVAGFSACSRALAQNAFKRQQALSKDLPDMLEVLAMGLRSGLSFDRSFALYGHYFSGVFAQECSVAHRLWTMGLISREEALRKLESSYDSRLLHRVIENMLRSLRFGSSLSEVLEDCALTARQFYRAELEERVAKAPVKMMIPTGTLILPAMLILVMGPVLLELMGGF